jgi:putative ABC transport system permease protein
MHELRTILRRLLRTPGFTAIAIVTLGAGIGANAAIFSLVNGVLLRPLPYPQADRLVQVQHDAPGLELRDMGVSKPLYLRYRDQAESFTGIGIYDDREVTITGDDRPQRLRAASITGSAFDVLGVAPLMGRAFHDDDSVPGAAPLVILAESLWRSRFGGDPRVLGRVVEVDGTSREVVGVMPGSFHFPVPETEVWLPRPLDPTSLQLGAFQERAVARLAPGATVASATADLHRLTGDLAAAFPEERAAPVLMSAGFAVRVVSLRDTVVGDLRESLWILFVGVGLILLIACANVANLFLVRTEGRHRELAIRGALGASRGAIVRGHMLESLVLAASGGTLGLVLTEGAVRLLRRFGPSELPRLHEVGVDGVVLAFTVVASVLAGVLFGTLPAVRAASPRFDLALKEGTRGSSEGPRRLRARSVLVVAQVALALVLLVGAGLMLRSLARLAGIDPGFEPAGAVSFAAPLPRAKYQDPEQTARWLDQAVAELAALPGVLSAAAVRFAPLSGEISGSGYALAGRPAPSEQDLPPVFFENYVSPSYFDTVGIPLLEGRLLERADWEQRTGAVLVNRGLAAQYWPGESAVGQRIWPGAPEENPRWYEVVGVVGDVRTTRLQDDPSHIVYFPFLGHADHNHDVDPNMGFVVRTAGDPKGIVDAARARLWQLEPDVPVTSVRTLEEMVRRARARTSFTVVLLALASVLALLLSLVGLYGVVSYLVTLRRREIGIRMALGADRSLVLRLVLGEGLRIGAVGAVLGLLGALLLVRALRTLLFEVGAFDPVTFMVATLLLLGCCGLASLVPARRAARTDPQVALRNE